MQVSHAADAYCRQTANYLSVWSSRPGSEYMTKSPSFNEMTSSRDRGDANANMRTVSSARKQTMSVNENDRYSEDGTNF